MPEPDDFTMIYDGKDMYLAADGVKIAKRSKGNTWISLEPGWRVLDGSDSITIEYTAPGSNDYANCRGHWLVDRTYAQDYSHHRCWLIPVPSRAARGGNYARQPHDRDSPIADYAAGACGPAGWRKSC